MSCSNCLTILEHHPLAGTIHQHQSVRASVPGDEGTHSLETIVAQVFGSLCRRFPDDETDIKLCRQTCKVNPETPGIPHTLWDETAGGAVVALDFAGDPADFLCLAHEIGHAVQLTVRSNDFIAPVQREIAAFLSELFLLNETDTLPTIGLYDAWNADNCEYYAADIQALKTALSDLRTPYSYRWNYAIARPVASAAFECLSTAELWRVFCGHHTVPEILEMIKTKGITGTHGELFTACA